MTGIPGAEKQAAGIHVVVYISNGSGRITWYSCADVGAVLLGGFAGEVTKSREFSKAVKLWEEQGSDHLGYRPESRDLTVEATNALSSMGDHLISLLKSQQKW